MGKKDCLSFTGNIHHLLQGARATAYIILIKLSQNVLISAPEWLIISNILSNQTPYLSVQNDAVEHVERCIKIFGSN